MRIFYTLAFSLFTYLAFSQVTVGESFSSKFNLDTEDIPVKTIQVDTENLVSQHMENGLRVGPLKVSEGVEVNDNPSNSGAWQDLGNGFSIWRITYQSENAYFLHFLIDEIKLTNGAQLAFFSENGFLGGIDEQLNLQKNFLTEFIEGEKVTVEFVKANTDQVSDINIKYVFHGFDDLGLNTSQSCENDADCPAGDSVDDQKRGILQLNFTIGNSGYVCSGSLVNNTAQDGHPYVLSANHCFDGIAINSNISSTVRINWKANNPQCPGTQSGVPNAGSYYIHPNGMKLLADYPLADMALLELNNGLNPNWEVHFNGWNNSTSAPSSGKGLHHPDGDLMMVSVENSPLVSQTITVSGQTSETWRVTNWDIGATEGGSSGSPIFDLNGHIVGQLFAGSSECTGSTDNGGSDFYGKLSRGWTGGGSTTNSLRFWLDPDNTGVVFLNGIFSSELGVDDITQSKVEISVYPNPVSEVLSISPDQKDVSYKYEIANSLGQYITADVAQGEVKIDVRQYEKGLYFIKLYKDGVVYATHQFIKR